MYIETCLICNPLWMKPCLGDPPSVGTTCVRTTKYLLEIVSLARHSQDSILETMGSIQDLLRAKCLHRCSVHAVTMSTCCHKCSVHAVMMCIVHMLLCISLTIGNTYLHNTSMYYQWSDIQLNSQAVLRAPSRYIYSVEQ